MQGVSQANFLLLLERKPAAPFLRLALQWGSSTRLARKSPACEDLLDDGALGFGVDANCLGLPVKIEAPGGSGDNLAGFHHAGQALEHLFAGQAARLGTVKAGTHSAAMISASNMT